MNENKNFSLGGFPPIYESVSYLKKKEYVPNNILSIQSILSRRSTNNQIKNNDIYWEEKNNDIDNFNEKQILLNMNRISKKGSRKGSRKGSKKASKKGNNLKKKKGSKKN